MPEPKTDLQALLRNENVIAAVLPAGRVFESRSRSIDLPPYWATLVITTHGEKVAYPAGGEVPGDDAEEVMVVRAGTFTLHFDIDQLASQDEFPCRASVAIELQVIPERSELVAFRENMASTKEVVHTHDMRAILQPAVCEGVRSFVGSCLISDLIGNLNLPRLFESTRSSIDPILFESGLSVTRLHSAAVDSKSFRQFELQRIDMERRKEQEHAGVQLQQAIQNAQDAHVSHLEEMLQRLRSLADESPQSDLSDLLKTFDDSQRGELYQALWSTESVVNPTQWIVVASGQELIYFNPTVMNKPSRKINLDSPAGALRSISFSVDGDGGGLLLVGAARGAHIVHAQNEKILGTYLVAVESGKSVRGGFNSVALAGEYIFAAHSELGLRRWLVDHPQESTILLSDLTKPAQAVRHVQFAVGKIWLSIDNEIFSMPVVGPHPEGCGLVEYRGSEASITALVCTDSNVFAGNSAGKILKWETARPDHPEIIYRGNNRPAESVSLLPAGGIERLFFTDTSPTLHAQVVGDAFMCRYQAGGQTIRSAQIGPDWIVAVNENRDRLFCWRTGEPSAPPTIIPAAQMTGRSIQDVCLVPYMV